MPLKLCQGRDLTVSSRTNMLLNAGRRQKIGPVASPPFHLSCTPPSRRACVCNNGLCPRRGKYHRVVFNGEQVTWVYHTGSQTRASGRRSGVPAVGSSAVPARMSNHFHAAVSGARNMSRHRSQPSHRSVLTSGGLFSLLTCGRTQTCNFPLRFGSNPELLFVTSLCHTDSWVDFCTIAFCTIFGGCHLSGDQPKLYKAPEGRKDLMIPVEQKVCLNPAPTNRSETAEIKFLVLRSSCDFCRGSCVLKSAK